MATVDGILLPRGDVGENGGNYALYTGAGVVSSSAHADSQPFKFSGDRPRDSSSDAVPSYYEHTAKQGKTLVIAMYMSLFAILGALVRIILAQLFGEECSNPGTVGWLAASSPLCVTADGSAQREGGIIFADLPANLIGSFVMGMLQSTETMGLPVSVPIAWVTVDSWFQHWDIIHLAMRTGFCGSLTTFSSWNSAMVVLIFGTGSDYTTQVVRAIFGYVIGMETALGSFVFGKKVAEWIFRWRNPSMWQEAMLSAEKKENGVYVDSELPDFERRFLANLDMPALWGDVDPDGLEFLARWRLSTEGARRLGHEDLETLKELEHRVLSQRNTFLPEDDSVCTVRGWDLGSLVKWTQGMAPLSDPIPNDHFLFMPIVSVGLFVCLYGLLVTGLLLNNGITAYAVTSKTMVFALLWAPPGALLRWQLGGFNGKVGGDWSWLPAGTLVANIFGSVVSITAIAVEYVSPAKGFWKTGTLRSLKIGFAGSLTTVSTFVAEVHTFASKKETQDRAYIYMLMSLLPSCLLGMLIFGVICSGKGY